MITTIAFATKQICYTANMIHAVNLLQHLRPDMQNALVEKEHALHNQSLLCEKQMQFII